MATPTDTSKQNDSSSLHSQKDINIPVDVSLCKSCYCMTHTIDGTCGKCGAIKDDTSLDEILDKYYAPIKLPDNNREGLKQAILSSYIKKQDVLDVVLGVLPTEKKTISTLQSDHDIGVERGRHDMLLEVRQALTTALKEKI